jgi:hypothetical protein
MMAHRRTQPIKPDRRRALELLASCRDGCTEALMPARHVDFRLLGFKTE